ncbi:hypothetical protein WJ438_10135 [Streptomyces sp. GD-15H]|uniref:hypothetical protein n=1 Tax=Streptomyces sp. GD-15H TaxID=3129112 RepID=UPI003245A57F
MNLQRPYGSAFEGMLTYLEWATESARMLRSQISDRDLDQLVFTDRYRTLLGSCGTLAGTAQQRLVNGLVQLVSPNGSRRSRRPWPRWIRGSAGGASGRCSSWPTPASTSRTR